MPPNKRDEKIEEVNYYLEDETPINLAPKITTNKGIHFVIFKREDFMVE